jgi:hypothetical protein
MRTLLCVLLAVAGAGCSLVKPYQREALAQPGMRLGPTPDSAAEQHMLESREASSGGFGAVGGGCGCN